MGRNINDDIYVMSNVLKCQLDENDVGCIKEDWRAFYEAPQEYEGDKLCDLILEDLGKQADPNWNKRTEENKMDLEIAMLGTSGVEMKHFSPDGTLGWGKLDGKNFYVRMVDRAEWYPLTKAITRDVKTYLNEYDREGGFNAVVYAGVGDYIVYVGCKDITDPDAYAPSGYTYAGLINVTNLEQMRDSDDIRNLEVLYTCFANASGDAKIPVLWESSTNLTTGPVSFSDISEELSVENLISPEGALLTDGIDDLMSRIKSKLPSVDLEKEKNKRYACVTVSIKKGGQDVDSVNLMYNRNHVAHNGAVSNIEALLPVIMAGLRVYGTEKLTKCNLQQLAAGTISRDDLVFSLETGLPIEVTAERDATPEEMERAATVSKDRDGVGASMNIEVTEGRIHHGSSMLDAVKSSAGTVKE